MKVTLSETEGRLKAMLSKESDGKVFTSIANLSRRNLALCGLVN